MTIPRFFSSPGIPEKDSLLRCDLCPGGCIIAPGKEGRCGVRANREGKPALPYYGHISSLALDPIEKKPLYHFRPGTEILSAGFVGCNLRCPFCQNWHISQSTDAPGRFYSPAELAAAAAESSGKGTARSKAAMHSLAYTYSEALIHAEFLLDCMKEAKDAGVANVLVTNGCFNSDAAVEILDLADAANIDLKCFSAETYRNVLGGDLETTLEFIRLALERSVHVELTTLVVTGLNDSRAELDKCRDFIAELESTGKTVPWHLSAYHPSYRWNAPATDPHSLAEAAERAGKKLNYVYTGNISVGKGGRKHNDTLCPGCGKTLVNRRNYRIDTPGLSLKEEGGKFSYSCRYCGRKLPIRS